MRLAVIVGLAIVAPGCAKHAPLETREARLSKEYGEALRAERERAAAQDRRESEAAARFRQSDEYKAVLLQAKEHEARVESARAVAACAQQRTLECAKRQLNDSDKPVDHQTALETLLTDCRLKVPTACLWLGDAYALGRGVAQDHVLARRAYAAGCNRYVGAT